MKTEKARSGRGWRPNVFDVVIVALILAVGAVVYLVLRPTPAASVAVTTTPLRYQVEMLNLPAGTHELMQVGDAVVDSAKNYAMGTVVAIDVQPYTVEVPDEAANVVRQAAVEGYETVVLTLEANVVQTDSAITTGDGYLIRVGLSTKTRGERYAATGYIVGIER